MGACAASCVISSALTCPPDIMLSTCSRTPACASAGVPETARLLFSCSANRSISSLPENAPTAFLLRESSVLSVSAKELREASATPRISSRRACTLPPSSTRKESRALLSVRLSAMLGSSPTSTTLEARCEMDESALLTILDVCEIVCFQ